MYTIFPSSKREEEGDLWAKPGQSEHEECLDDDTNKWKKDILHIMA